MDKKETFPDFELPLVDPVSPPIIGELKQSRLPNFASFKSIEDPRERILEVLIRTGPICQEEVATYAGLPIEITFSLLSDLLRENAIALYEKHEGSLIFYCP